MRTTLTVDDDLQRQMLDQARALDVPYRQVVNDALRRGLEVREGSPPVYAAPVFDMGLARVDLVKALALSQELDDAKFVARENAKAGGESAPA
jgi:hypothetical protein